MLSIAILWLADSKTILFQSYRSGDGSYLDIYAVDMGTKAVTQISLTAKVDKQKPIHIQR